MAKSSFLSEIIRWKFALGRWCQASSHWSRLLFPAAITDTGCLISPCLQRFNRGAQKQGVRTQRPHKPESPSEDVPERQHRDTELPRSSPDLCTDPMLTTESPQGTQTAAASPPRGLEFTNSVPGHPLAFNTTCPPLGTSTGWPILLNSTSAFDSTAKSPHSLRFWPTNPAFLGHISEPQGRPTRGGGYSDVWCCEVQFCTPSERLPTKASLT